jgi:uncharacterized membrane protein YjjB (DUF3815 family)
VQGKQERRNTAGQLVLIAGILVAFFIGTRAYESISSWAASSSYVGRAMQGLPQWTPTPVLAVSVPALAPGVGATPTVGVSGLVSMPSPVGAVDGAGGKVWYGGAGINTGSRPISTPIPGPVR